MAARLRAPIGHCPALVSACPMPCHPHKPAQLLPPHPASSLAHAQTLAHPSSIYDLRRSPANHTPVALGPKTLSFSKLASPFIQLTLYPASHFHIHQPQSHLDQLPLLLPLPFPTFLRTLCTTLPPAPLSSALLVADIYHAARPVVSTHTLAPPDHHPHRPPAKPCDFFPP